MAVVRSAGRLDISLSDSASTSCIPEPGPSSGVEVRRASLDVSFDRHVSHMSPVERSFREASRL